MWIRIKGILYNLEYVTSIRCCLDNQFILLTYANAGNTRTYEGKYIPVSDCTFIRFSIEDGDEKSDCYNNYLRILEVLSLPQDDFHDFNIEPNV